MFMIVIWLCLGFQSMFLNKVAIFAFFSFRDHLGAFHVVEIMRPLDKLMLRRTISMEGNKLFILHSRKRIPNYWNNTVILEVLKRQKLTCVKATKEQYLGLFNRFSILVSCDAQMFTQQLLTMGRTNFFVVSTFPFLLKLPRSIEIQSRTNLVTF